MRPGIDATWIAALSSAGITTAYLARLDFASETVTAWTGAHAIEVNGSGDPLLDGLTFSPFEHGVMVAVGENAFSYTGSEAFELTLSIPQSVPLVI